MKKELTRRDLIGRAGLALGGVMTLGALQACGSESDPAPTEQTPAASPQVADFPYQQHLAAGYQLDPAPIREAAYQGYYAGGCCHGAYSALVAHLAATAGAPFTLLPLDFGKFGGGGIASYGSICGAVLGGVLVINMITSNATARANMMTDLMRWYEGNAFPAYAPAAVNAGETGLTLDFAASNLVTLQAVPGSHLCHASVSSWGAARGVSATGADKKARCARLTADVAGKVAEMLNAYLASGAYTAAAIDDASATCLGCHPGTATARAPVASGMGCGSCHPDKLTNHPAF
jgi:hypothetical protein